MIKRFEQFTSAISGIYRDVQRLERDEMERYGLKGAFAQYLLAIDRHPDGITAAQLCETCDRNKAAVSRIVAEMEEKDLIIRDSTRNQYKALIFLTKAGKNAVRFVKERSSIAAQVAGSELSDEDRTILYASLRRIAAHLERFCREGIPSEPITSP